MDAGLVTHPSRKSELLDAVPNNSSAVRAEFISGRRMRFLDAREAAHITADDSSLGRGAEIRNAPKTVSPVLTLLKSRS